MGAIATRALGDAATLYARAVQGDRPPARHLGRVTARHAQRHEQPHARPPPAHPSHSPATLTVAARSRPRYDLAPTARRRYPAARRSPSMLIPARRPPDTTAARGARGGRTSRRELYRGMSAARRYVHIAHPHPSLSPSPSPDPIPILIPSPSPSPSPSPPRASNQAHAASPCSSGATRARP